MFLETRIKGGVKRKKCNLLQQCLGYDVEFENGLTFKTLFKLILKEKTFFNALFKRELNGTKIEDFEQRFRTRKKKEGIPLSYLEISRFINVADRRIEKMDMLTILTGVEVDDKENEIAVPLTVFSIDELRDLEVYISDFMETYIDMPTEEEPEGHIVISGYVSITLYHAIQAVLYEIAFYGTPDEKDEEIEMIMSNVSEESMKENLERQIEALVKEDKFEECAKLKKMLDNIKKEQEGIRKIDPTPKNE